MKQGIKNTLMFVSGAAIGSGITTLALRAFYTKFINDTLTVEINNQIDEIKAEYAAKLEKIEAEYVENQTKTAEKEKKQAKSAPKTTKKETKEAPAKKTKEEKKEEAVDYTKFSEGKSNQGPVTTVKDLRTVVMEQIADDTSNNAGSYIVTMGDFTEDNGYEKVTSTYYQGDNVFTNDYDDPDPELNTIIGELIKKFDQYGEGNSIFIRNDQRETDYEVIFDEGSYGE